MNVYHVFTFRFEEIRNNNKWLVFGVLLLTCHQSVMCVGAPLRLQTKYHAQHNRLVFWFSLSRRLWATVPIAR